MSKEIYQELKNQEQKLKTEKDSLLKKNLPEVSLEQENLENEENQGFLGKMKAGLSKTRKKLVEGFIQSLVGERELDDDLFDEIEENLLMADLGVPTTRKIMDYLEDKYAAKEINSEKDAFTAIKKVIYEIMDKHAYTPDMIDSGPTVFLFVGVNGVGKTTSIGKLASKFKAEGKKVLVAAGDTFRAAAIEQLVTWADRAGVDCVAKEIGSDPSATLYEAAEKAKNEGYDVLLCDTSGRLHTKKNLMDELEKMQRVIKKVIPDGPHHSFLVLDATTGQNAIVQTKEFKEIIGLDGLIVTKLDGTAKGGVVIGIVNEFDVPVVYIGVGEKVDDLQPFSSRAFADSLFEE